MSSTPSPLIKAELQTLGENANLWGDPNLNNALKCFEESSKGFTTVSIGASDVTLASTNFTPSVSQHYRYATLRLTAGAGVGARNVIVPGVAGRWTVHNASGFTQTIKTSGSSVVATVNNNEILTVYCDGTDCYNQTSGTSMAAGTLTGALNWAAAVTLASASTVNIGAAASNYVFISGTTTITAFDTIAQGAVRLVCFLGALTLTHNASTINLPGAANITTAAGDCALFISDGSGSWRCLSYTKAAAPSVPHGQCYLSKSGANLVLMPYNGNSLIIGGAVQTIPAAGVSLAPTSLSVGTTYYIYAYMSGTTMTLEASVTAQALQTSTGVYTKTADTTRTLVGMARIVTGPAWVDSATQRFVLSFFNRKGRSLLGSNTGPSTASTSAVELSTSQRVEFLTWVDENVDVEMAGSLRATPATGTTGGIYVGIDGTGTGTATTFYTVDTANYNVPASARWLAPLSDGYHFATQVGSAPTGGTTTFNCILVGTVNG